MQGCGLVDRGFKLSHFRIDLCYKPWLLFRLTNNKRNEMRELLRFVAYMFYVNHEIARDKRRARKAGIDVANDEEWLVANDLEAR